MFRPCLLSAAICTALYSPAFAQSADEAVMLAPITVTSSREQSPLNKLANNITVINEARLQDAMAVTVEDALESVPGVSFDGQGRYGLSDVTIRGVSGNRVKMLVDGQELAGTFSFGPFQSAGRQYMDLSNMKQVEIIKGPVSSLHGSDAIGGVVSFVSKTPDDYLQAGEAAGDSVFSEYHGDDESINLGATLAFAPSPQWDGLISFSHSNGHEQQNHGGNQLSGAARSSPDPQDQHSNHLQAQLRFKPNDNHRFTLSAASYHFYRDTDIQSSLGAGTGGFVYNDYDSQDRQKRHSFSLRHDFSIKQSWADSGHWRIFFQQQRSQQNTFMNANLRGAPAERLRESDYEVEEIGGEAQFYKHIGGSLSQDWVYGLQLSRKEVEMLRYTYDRIGASSSEAFEKNAPDSSISQIGVFAQNRLSFGDSGFSLIPGLRYDYYRLKTDPDARFWSTVGSNYQLQNLSEGELSLRLGALYDLNDEHSLYANYAEGFRAPGFQETNLGFENYSQGYGYVANPDLQPEKSRGVELGWRSDNGIFHHDLSLFYTRYRNFIQTQTAVGRNPATGLIEFTSINLPSAEIYGAELSAGLDFGGLNPALEGLSADMSLAYAKGKDRDSGEPIDAVEPLSGHVGLAYADPDARWGLGAKLRFAGGKDSEDISSASQSSRSGPILPTGGYGVFDLTGYYRPIQDLTIRAGVFNAFDKHYISWSDAKSYSPLNRQRYSAPGRWFGASIRYDF